MKEETRPRTPSGKLRSDEEIFHTQSSTHMVEGVEVGRLKTTVRNESVSPVSLGSPYALRCHGGVGRDHRVHGPSTHKRITKIVH